VGDVTGVSPDDVGAAAELCPNGHQVVFNSVFGMMAVPWCPHEGCGWSMPELWCPDHGNFGMTYLSTKVGRVLVHVKAVLDIPQGPLP
jgi:hypothetical protein